MSKLLRQLCYLFLCLVPFVNVPLVGNRALRLPGVYQVVGGVLFAAVVAAAWVVGARKIWARDEEKSSFALAGCFLIAPWAIISLLWVGLGTPWEAGADENKMRYLVLLTGSVAVTAGFVIVKEALSRNGEHLYSSLGFAAGMLSGAAYLVWTSFQVGIYALKTRDGGQTSPQISMISDLLDALLFAACVLTYLATAAYAASFGQAGWLERAASRVYVFANFFAVLFLLMRGVSFPNPDAGATPWYTNLGFIVGIPAVPWIMPFLLGVVLLRIVGSEDYLPKSRDISIENGAKEQA
jgi:hypothetical protein